MRWISALSLMALPGLAQAFPVVIAGIGGAAFGTLLLPVLLFFIAAYFVFGPKRTSRGFNVSALLFCTFVFYGLFVERASEDSYKTANIYTSGAPAEARNDIPFSFMEITEQRNSPQGITAQDLVSDLNDGVVSILRVDIGNGSLFRDLGNGFSVDDAWKNPSALIAAIQNFGRPVVLIDGYGGLAGEMAKGLAAKFGINVGFLIGGTASISPYGWDGLSMDADPHALTVDGYQAWLEKTPDALVIGITTEDEFLRDGWIHGDLTLSMGEFLSGLDRLAEIADGRPVMVSGFETYASGSTWVAVSLLRGKGLDVYFVMPREEEILLKPSYVRSFHNSDRIFGLGDAKRYVLHRPDLAFLDFQSKDDWDRTKRKLPRTFHIDMEDIAKGKLSEWVQSLDPAFTYAGLAYDRRTAYHSKLAGDVLTSNGSRWMGSFIRPEIFSDELFSVPELNGFADKAAISVSHIRHLAGGQVSMLLGSARAVEVLLALISVAITAILARPFSNAVKLASTLVLITIFDSIEAGGIEYTDFGFSTHVVLLIYGVLMAAGHRLILNRLMPLFSIEHAGGHRTLPPKAKLLEAAHRNGFNVKKGYLVTADGLRNKKILGAATRKMLVRSCGFSESLSSESTGKYQSIVIEKCQSTQQAVDQVLSIIDSHGKQSCALVQQFVEAKVYGVAMFGVHGEAHTLICESGEYAAVTSGQGDSKRVQVEAWAIGKAPSRERGVFKALVRLNKLVGATSIEWAITRLGTLFILQVNTDESAGAGAMVLLNNINKKFVELPTAHPDPVSSAIIAACAADCEQLSFGNRRFTKVHSTVEGWLILHAELTKVLGRIPKEFPFSFPVVDVLNAYSAAKTIRHSQLEGRIFPLDASPEQLIKQVVNEIENIRDLYGRFNRLATLALDLKAYRHEGKATQRISDTALSGMAVKGWGTSKASDEPIGLAPLVGFDVLTNCQSFEHEYLPTTLLYITDDILWIKDSCAAMLMAELEPIRLVAASIVARGYASHLLSALNRTCGVWSGAERMPFSLHPENTPSRLRDLLSTPIWKATGCIYVHGVPSEGLRCHISTPEAMRDGDALLIDNASMDHLADLERASAVVVRKGAVLSHLMQHARRMGLPIVIGGVLPHLADRCLVEITVGGQVINE